MAQARPGEQGKDAAGEGAKGEAAVGGVAKYRASEGKTVEVPYRGLVEGTMSELIGGVRSAMTYIGAVRLKEMPKRTTFIMVGSQLNTVFGG
ncbi:IMP dehydrogenase [Bosea sp. LjRoot9]|uniref:IMP dehydrogenase n=1 Tax=Bosea sp. LjRoot9 TaxID=3342341 RepID=UPI003F500FA6